MSIVWVYIRTNGSERPSILSCLRKSKERQPQYPMEKACGLLNKIRVEAKPYFVNDCIVYVR